MRETLHLPPESLAALVDASAAINAAQTLDETLDAIARAAAAVMRAQASSVIILDRARGKQVFRAAVGDRAGQLIGRDYDEGVGISAKVLDSGKAAIVSDVSADEAHFKGIDMLVKFKTRSLIAAPLIHKGRRLGVVEVLNPVQGERFTETDRQLAQVFANLAAIAAANSQRWDQLQKDNRGLKQAMREPGKMVGASRAIEKVRGLIDSVAASPATVLLLGETGTGKEVAARRIHANCDRRERSFIAVNCAALPETLLESELFGHEAGAFTGATKRKLGRVELADGGSILLDEVAEIPPEVQVKLLRVLEEKEIVRLGGTSPVGCDVRVITATNRDLEAEMRTGRFRDDLYYRLNVFPIELPPLRRRKEDIPLLTDYFLERLAGEMKMAAPTISDQAMAVLSAYDFPGNVRELQNILERACLLCRPEAAPGARTHIRPEHLPRELFAYAREADPATGESALAAGEKAMILGALAENNWNQSRAARALGISRDQLRYRVKKYGIRRAR